MIVSINGKNISAKYAELDSSGNNIAETYLKSDSLTGYQPIEGMSGYLKNSDIGFKAGSNISIGGYNYKTNFACGSACTAENDSFVQGCQCFGEYNSCCIGTWCTANHGLAIGESLVVNGGAAIGTYNATSSNVAFVIGIGSADNYRRDIFKIIRSSYDDLNGNVSSIGNYYGKSGELAYTSNLPYYITYGDTTSYILNNIIENKRKINVVYCNYPIYNGVDLLKYIPFELDEYDMYNKATFVRFDYVKNNNDTYDLYKKTITVNSNNEWSYNEEIVTLS